jgi:hypothetical protein
VSGRARAALAVACVTVAAIAVAGCSGDDDELPEGSVARVGEQTIDRDELRREVAALERGARRSDAQPEQIERQALATLIQTALIEQEAERRGIEVTRAETRRRWRSATADQFKTAKQLRRFLGGQTQDDLIRQLRLQLLSQAIEQQVRVDAGPDGADRAVERFREEIRKRALDETVCGEGYSAPGCP